MARRIPVREMLRLRASGLSATAIARAQPVSKTSVVDTFHAADEKGVAWEDVEGMSDAEAYVSNRPLQSMRYCEWEPLVANVRYWHREPSIFRKGAACCYLRLAMSESRRRRFSAWRIESGPRTS